MSNVLQLANVNAPFNQNVTTVWLLATTNLASSSKSLTKGISSSNNTARGNGPIKKKDIFNVCIPQTCQTIQQNENQLSLRHVSNLLYGVTICYNKKIEFILNDLENVLIQLRRRNLMLFSKTQNQRQQQEGNNDGDTGSGKKKTNLVTIRGNDSNVFYKNDAMFDIEDIRVFNLDTTENNGLKAFHNNDTSSGLIKRFDYLTELTNNNIVNIDQNNDFAEDDVNIDDDQMIFNSNIDFELDIDDEHSKLSSNYHHINTGHNDDDFRYNIDSQQPNLELNFDINEKEKEKEKKQEEEKSQDQLSHNNLSEFNELHQGNNENEQEEEADLADESISSHDSNEPPLKKFKSAMPSGLNSNQTKHVFTTIGLDERIGLLTETLRHNNENYLELMEDTLGLSRGNNITAYKNNQREDEENKIRNYFMNDSNLSKYWKQTFWNNGNNTLSSFLFDSTKSEYSHASSIERGRKRLSSLSSNSRSNSNQSEEYGRRMNLNSKSVVNGLFGNDLEDDNNNLLLNLEQINEDLEDEHEMTHFQFGTNASNMGNHDLMQIDLNLPPSSFGRNLSRSVTSLTGGHGLSSHQQDVVDVLQNRFVSGNNVGYNYERSSFATGSSSQTQSYNTDSNTANTRQTMTLDIQARRFYEYIKERAEFIGTTTHSTPSFKKKLLFEDIVPSKLSASDEQNPGNLVDRCVAAGAFFSLLNLASGAVIHLEEYNPEKKDLSSKILQPDELIIKV
ncbi:Rec8p NDAI_0C06130 [Naumovozyma dairenensis CBS 421]|uniref:Rad21/Rec8-like protein N-terminal domain-containing protein n=1 Tax=Naumovozyma dairenensis (strain ATCC 10597 / BCRC 20456 / CBS 421 / NBRC 0211 / NRRL Y-12639) TaxID=1071378 RepID=G0W911_NAUDC|nr:hypothetical protein NDAI_0C06130 [Naumovozyma dairenensis CBS 421]CCD24272.1 hypothetical protein NDAI_0C06130 [Naumovozyma dairenensis CBS 421]